MNFLGNLHFEQDPNDFQKWIISNNNSVVASSNTNSDSIKTQSVSHSTTQLSTENSGETSLSTSELNDSNNDYNFISTPSTSFNSLLKPKKQSKRVACNCPNCLNIVPGQRTRLIFFKFIA